MEEKKNAVKKLYDVAAGSAKTEKPKRSLFSVKCPKCSSKLRKTSEKLLIIVGLGGGEFADAVAKDLSLEPGAYNLCVDNFKCDCGYEFGRASAQAVESGA